MAIEVHPGWVVDGNKRYEMAVNKSKHNYWLKILRWYNPHRAGNGFEIMPKEIPDGIVDMLLVSHLFEQFDKMPADVLKTIHDELSRRLEKTKSVVDVKVAPNLSKLMDYVEEAAETHGHELSTWKYNKGENVTSFVCKKCGLEIGIEAEIGEDGKTRLIPFGVDCQCNPAAQKTIACKSEVNLTISDDILERAMLHDHDCDRYPDDDDGILVECVNCGAMAGVSEGRIVFDNLRDPCKGGVINVTD